MLNIGQLPAYSFPGLGIVPLYITLISISQELQDPASGIMAHEVDINDGAPRRSSNIWNISIWFATETYLRLTEKQYSGYNVANRFPA